MSSPYFLEFHTNQQTYIVSQQPEPVKSIFSTHGVKISDLCFANHAQRKQLGKKLFLLAMQDELNNQHTSPLAALARKIIS